MKIAIIDYGLGNLRSVEKALQFVGAPDAFITDDPSRVASADKAVLPGDGAFDATMDRLRASGVDRIVREFVATGKPFLGICVGMQVLLTESEEGRRGVKGLDLVPGVVRRFKPVTDADGCLQIGWDELQFPRDSELFAGINPGSMVYFLHSYYCAPAEDETVSATAEYCGVYCAGLQRGNIHATQFHPEKSGPVGLSILQNFARL